MLFLFIIFLILGADCQRVTLKMFLEIWEKYITGSRLRDSSHSWCQRGCPFCFPWRCVPEFLFQKLLWCKILPTLRNEGIYLAFWTFIVINLLCIYDHKSRFVVTLYGLDRDNFIYEEIFLFWKFWISWFQGCFWLTLKIILLISNLLNFFSNLK